MVIGKAIPMMMVSLVLTTVAADARWVWPWEQRRVVHRRHIQRPPSPPVDCNQIIEAVRILDPDRLAQALRQSTKKQRDVIAKCVTGTQGGQINVFTQQHRR